MIEELSKNVRLGDEERRTICQVIQDVSSQNGVSWHLISLFGSRTKPGERGGDIDLYLEVLPTAQYDSWKFKRAILTALKSVLGDQKIDIIINDGVTDLGAFREIIFKEKVDLWKKR